VRVDIAAREEEDEEEEDEDSDPESVPSMVNKGLMFAVEPSTRR
jgi:hypothetical protein